ncbi:acyl carrier protein [Peptoniphilus sp. KCTC 25270]|uniref:acyl carrier protein n=1 Tax=Peptoniphilus sp. KCTC 25270 TaxID=2897414 RepID=UPI001E2947AD|nr:acyl carrier protein [Peptoniphilus sp. KCTC 25270]MCD1147070.1 acyl carrier protein [Peptoniphilus sp. KCTC 25270]
MKEKILEMIAEQFNVSIENLNGDTNFVDDLNADSIELVEMVMSLEEEFDIQLEDEELAEIKTIGDVLELIENIEA